MLSLVILSAVVAGADEATADLPNPTGLDPMAVAVIPTLNIKPPVKNVEVWQVEQMGSTFQKRTVQLES